MISKKKFAKLTPEEQGLLTRARNILDIRNLPGWKDIVSFMRESVSYPNPSQFSTERELLLPYTKAYGADEAVKSVISFVDSQENVIKNLTEQMSSENDLPNWEIGE